MAALQRAYQLKGHCGPVICCRSQDNSNVLVSGSEDGSMCLFDLASCTLIRRCIGFQDGDVTSLSFHPLKSHSLFASSGADIWEFDLRSLDSNIMDAHVNRWSFGGEEINCIDMHTNGAHLAIADDAGDITILDVNHRTPRVQVLHGGHTNICSSTLFSPYSENELISGGLDCRLVGWDFVSSNVKWTRGMEAGSGGAQVFNPPMVHSLCVPKMDANEQPWLGLIATGRGDGGVWVGFGGGLKEAQSDDDLNDENVSSACNDSPNGLNGTMEGGVHLAEDAMDDEDGIGGGEAESDFVVLDSAFGGHCSFVSCVSFLARGSGQKLVSGGNDGRICVWNWLEACEGQDGGIGSPLLLNFEHRLKVNALHNRAWNGEEEVFVGDVCNDVTVYKLQ